MSDVDEQAVLAEMAEAQREIDEVSLARIVIDKYGADSDKPSVKLAVAHLNGAHERDRLRSELKRADRYGSERFAEAVKIQTERDAALAALAAAEGDWSSLADALVDATEGSHEPTPAETVRFLATELIRDYASTCGALKDVTAERDAAIACAESAAETALHPIRRALFLRGHCGDGGLAPMVERALDEARQHGRNEDRELHDALLEASDAFPSDMEGTVAARVRALIAQRDQAAAQERERCIAIIESNPSLGDNIGGIGVHQRMRLVKLLHSHTGGES